ncbi:MAG: M14 family zinc carboxypeptidase [Ignavibacteriaceae bacterium]
MTHNIQFAWNLYYGYENYRENSLTHRRFKHSEIISLVEQLKNKNIFRVNKVGESVQERNIFTITIGNGAKKIFCWSQMHGNEPTATAAIFDIMNFFLAEQHFKEFKQHLLNNVTLYFMPMVNPDGAEVFSRRNDIQIDLNRDAVKQESPEAKLLNKVFNSIQPEFGFNLHDQSSEYSAGNSSNYTALSFLAPPIDFDKTVNESRTKSMLLICELYNVLSEIIPGHIARYEDDFEPRAFGDNFAKKGSNVVLIESGAWIHDREKQFLRKLNFIALLTAFKSIAENSYLKEDIDTYHSIPENKKLMMDFIIRNALITKEDQNYSVDVGINYEEVNIPGTKDFFYKAKIEDIGDLSVFTGFKEFDATSLTLEPGKTPEHIYDSIEEVKNLDTKSLLEEGVTNVKLNNINPELKYSPIIFNLILNNIKRSEKIKEESIPNFILRKNGVFKYAVINGFLVSKNLSRRPEGNALIFGKCDE